MTLLLSEKLATGNLNVKSVSYANLISKAKAVSNGFCTFSIPLHINFTDPAHDASAVSTENTSAVQQNLDNLGKVEETTQPIQFLHDLDINHTEYQDAQYPLKQSPS